ncbi:MAG TPA: hypothetical protein VH589_08215 [Trebonia sp.]|jgi:hypothetical protein
MTDVIAALIAAAVATFGYVITARTKFLKDRRKTYAEALAAVHAFQELSHRIRRRPDSNPTTIDKLGTIVSGIQRDLDFYRSLLYLDSRELGDAYYALAQASRDQEKKLRDEAWAQPPAMSYPEPYRFKVRVERELCLERMRQHLRLIPLRGNQN